jgi:hypothetical protein
MDLLHVQIGLPYNLGAFPELSGDALGFGQIALAVDLVFQTVLYSRLAQKFMAIVRSCTSTRIVRLTS